MPLPLIIAGIAAGAIGAIEHKSAKETNEEAERKIRNAQSMYDNAKESLEAAKTNSNQSLKNLGNTKVKALNGSVKQFVQVYDRIKSIKLSESVGLNEISNFKIEDQAVIELNEMADIYSDSVSSGVAGAAAGAVVALAASGSLPIVTGTLSIAGSMLTLGNVGVAAGYAGSALSAAASATPLAAIVAPVMLFTGISASMKADENLEKARTVYAQAEKACEEMKVSQTLCKAVADRAEMFNNLLIELDGMFSECTQILDSVIKEKTGLMGNRAITADDLSIDELELIAVARSLAGAVKAVIDTPILDGENLSKNALNVYDDTTKCLPKFTEDVQNVKDAKELSDKVKQFFDDAWKLYDDSQKSLLSSQVYLREALLELGYTKKNILDNMIELFLPIYDRINGIWANESWGNADYIIGEQDIRQLKEIANVYSAPVPDGMIGINAGVIIALAVSGFLPIKTGVLSTDGVELRVVNIEKVDGIDGLALAYGASIAPLAWISIPEVSFDGVSPKGRAKDNYENARRIYSEAKIAAERMEKSVGRSKPIIQKAGIINGLLDELYRMFFECISILETVMRKKTKKLGSRIFEKRDFTEKEFILVVLTETLASALIKIISIPLINEYGELSDILIDVYGNVSRSMPEFKKQIENIRSYRLVRKNATVKLTSNESVGKQSTGEMVDKKREKKINRKAILSLVISIIAWVGLFTFFISIVGGIWSLMDGIISLKGKTKYKSCAIIGIILSVLILILILCVIGIAIMTG